MIDKLTNDLMLANASLEAHKQMLNESLQSSIVLRTNMLVFQGMYTDTKKQLEDLTKEHQALLNVNEVTE